MYSFSKEVETDINNNLKSIKKTIIEILMFFIEMIMVVLPIIVVWIISTLIANSKFPLLEYFVNSELLWFSITTLVLLNFKSIIFKRHNALRKRIPVLFALFALLVYNAIFIFLQLSELNIIQVSLNTNNVIKCIVVCTIITIIINISAIITDRKED